jgi:hypothetical protein
MYQAYKKVMYEMDLGIIGMLRISLTASYASLENFHGWFS